MDNPDRYHPDRYHTDYNNNTYQTGLVGTRYFQMVMAQRNVATNYIDFTYDVILPKNRYAVEIKTRKPHIYNKKGKADVYWFHFTDTQSQKNAFDYAVCCCIDDDYNVKATYVIPQRLIHERGEKYGVGTRISIPVKPKISSDVKILLRKDFLSYHAWQICRDRFDVFEIDNKSTFTRTKNRIYNQLISYEEEQRNYFALKVKELYDEGKYVKDMAKILGVSEPTIRKFKDRLNLPKGKNPNASYSRKGIKEEK